VLSSHKIPYSDLVPLDQKNKKGRRFGLRPSEWNLCQSMIDAFGEDIKEFNMDPALAKSLCKKF